MSRYLCRETFREHHYIVMCDVPADVVWRDPVTGIIHPRCAGHAQKEARQEAAMRRWVPMPTRVDPRLVDEAMERERSRGFDA